MNPISTQKALRRFTESYDYNGEHTRCERLTGFDHRFLIVLSVLLVSGWALFLTFMGG